METQVRLYFAGDHMKGIPTRNYMKIHTSCMRNVWIRATSPLPHGEGVSPSQKTFGDVKFKHILPSECLTSAVSGQEHVASISLHTDPTPQLVTKLQYQIKPMSGVLMLRMNTKLLETMSFSENNQKVLDPRCPAALYGSRGLVV